MDGTFDIVGTGDREREERRRLRLASLGVMREVMVAEVERLGAGAAGRLPGYEQDEFERRVKDPALSMSRLSRDVCRVVVLEERLDEDAETRARRLEEEQAERERKASVLEAALKRDAGTAVLMEKKRTARDTVCHIYREVYPQTTEMELKRLLDGLLEDYELDFDDDLDEAYGDPLAVVVARLCEEAELIVEPPDDEAEDGEPPMTERERLVRLAQEYVDIVVYGDGAANGNAAGEPVRVSAQGPPG